MIEKVEKEDETENKIAPTTTEASISADANYINPSDPQLLRTSDAARRMRSLAESSPEIKGHLSTEQLHKILATVKGRHPSLVSAIPEDRRSIFSEMLSLVQSCAGGTIGNICRKLERGVMFPLLVKVPDGAKEELSRLEIVTIGRGLKVWA